MKKIINLVEIQSPIPNFDGDDKGISCGLLPRINIARQGRRIGENARETKGSPTAANESKQVFYFAGTAKNQTSNPNTSSVPTSENSV